MRILLTGQSTLHWGRLEYGNIGNYYIIEPLVRELHRVFPGVELVTTFQMTDKFCEREKVACLPMELFYAWKESDVPEALKELGIAVIYNQTGKLIHRSPYIDEVLKSDLVLDFSGEMWGDHAEPVGKDRFLVGLIKNRVAQLLGKPTVMLAGSQGHFTDDRTTEFARVVFKDFKLVANREAVSAELLKRNGFDIARVKSFACPGFLFEPTPDHEMTAIIEKEKIKHNSKKTVGFVLCGFNMLEGPYDKWPRCDDEFTPFAEAVEFMVNDLGTRVVLMSHQNGFELPPNFKLIRGRDYPIVKQLQTVVGKRGNVHMDDVLCIDNVYSPWETKAIIKQFDMFVTGRLHASVAAISQSVPTVVIMHGHGPKSHKTIGMFRIAGLEEYVAYPNVAEDLKIKINQCWNNRDQIRAHLDGCIPKVKQLAKDGFDAIKHVVDECDRLSPEEAKNEVNIRAFAESDFMPDFLEHRDLSESLQGLA